MKFKATGIKIDTAGLRGKLLAQIEPQMRSVGESMGAVLVSQTQARFADGGDEEVTWAPLWVNDDGKVAAVTARTGVKSRRARAADIEGKADKSIARADREHASGKINRSTRARRHRQAESKKKKAAEVAGGVPSNRTRKGGQPLRDNGAAMASFVSVVDYSDGLLTIKVGSPLPYAKYHHDGFSTSGPNYIPLTDAARGGWNEKLIPGYDYAIVQGVTVPARPIVRATPGNIEELKVTFAGA